MWLILVPVNYQEKKNLVVYECTDPNDELFLSGQAHEDYRAKEPPSMFIELLAGKEMNKRDL